MKSRLLVLVAVSCLALNIGAWAQPSGSKSGNKKAPAQKSAADLALDEFGKSLTQATKPDQAKLQKVVHTGMAYLVEHPTHARVNDVVRDMANFGRALREKSIAHFRPVYVSQLRYELVNQRYKEGLSDDTRVALAALDAAVADYEARESASRANVETIKEKIDALAALPGSARFLRERHEAYVEVLTVAVSPASAEAHLQTLLTHSDEGLAKWAADQVNLVQVKQQPYELKFTALDGKPCDVAGMRGKVVALVFWSAANQGSTRDLLSLQSAYNSYRKRGFEIVTVSYDKSEDRDKVVKFAKDNRLAWPVYFDGTGMNNEFGQKLNVRRVPAIALFDKKGILVAHDLRANRVGPEVARLLGIKEEAPPPPAEMPDMGGGGGGRRRR